jgi:hypothetical protein
MSESEDKEKKAYEARLQRRLQLLRDQLEAGKVKFVKGLKVIESLKAVRYATDGSVDLNTVDGSVRALAGAIEMSHEREELKKAFPLSKIQNAYFDFLDKNFGSFYKIMVERGLTPHQAGLAASKNNSAIEEITKPLPDFLKFIEEFWTYSGDAAHAHVEDMHESLKGVFGGDLFPSKENIVSKCGLYIDTLILPDPFLRSKHVFKRGKPKDHAYYLIKHGLNLLQYRDLACADVMPPIVAVLPDMSAIEKSEYEFFRKLGSDDALIHAGKIFGRKFDSVDELKDFAGKLNTPEKVVSRIADKTRVLFDTKLKGDLKDQIVKVAQDEYAELLGTTNPGILVASLALGRMSVSNELLVKARRLRGTPIIEAPTSWQYFVWKLEYDAEKVERETNLKNLHVLRGLQALSENEMEWLGRVPLKALIKLRKTQAIGEIRGILGSGIEKIAQADPTNFYRTTDHVFDNIEKAFEQHRKNIKKLSDKKWKFAGSDIGSWLVVGTLAVTAAATGSPAAGIAAIAADQLLDPPKLKHIPKSIQELADESKKIKRSPVGMLFKYSGEK